MLSYLRYDSGSLCRRSMLILCRKTMYCEVKERDFVLKHHAGRGFSLLLLVLGLLLWLGWGELESVRLVAFAIADLLPRTVGLKVSECLGELQRL